MGPMESRDHGVAGDSGSWELPPIDGLPPPLDQLEIFAGAGIWDWDLRRQRLYRSPGWRRLYGRFDPNEQPFEIGDWLSWLIPADRGPAQAELDRLLAERFRHAEIQLWSPTATASIRDSIVTTL